MKDNIAVIEIDELRSKHENEPTLHEEESLQVFFHLNIVHMFIILQRIFPKVSILMYL